MSTIKNSSIILFIIILIIIITNTNKSIVSASSYAECSLDSDCQLAPYQQCQHQSSQNDVQHTGTCVHKRAFPMQLQQIIGTACVTFGLSLCNAGGVGGGPILVPILVLFSRFSQGQAIALVNFIILIGGVVRFIRNYSQKHPDQPHRVAIDYNIATILMPMTLFGTTIGVFINTTFPEPVIVIMMVVVFLAASGQTIKKGVERCKKERLDRRKSQIASVEALMIQGQNDNKSKDTRNDSKYYKKQKGKSSISYINKKFELGLGDNQEQIASKLGKVIQICTIKIPINDYQIRLISSFTLSTLKSKNKSNSDNLEEQQQQSRDDIYIEDYDQSELPNFNDNYPSKNKVSFQEKAPKSPSISQKSQDKDVLSISDDSTLQGSKLNLSKALIKIHKMQGSHCIWYKLFLICFVLISLTITSIIRKSGMVESCGKTDWILQGALLSISILATVVASIFGVCEDRKKARNFYKFQDSDFRFNSFRKVFGLSVAALFGTAIATAIGSGGGTIYSPLLLGIGLPPEVTSATAMYLIMFKSLATVIQFSVIKQIDWEYAVWFGIFALIAVLFLSQKMQDCSRKRQSVLIIILGLVIMAGAFLMPAIIVSRILNDSNQGILDVRLWRMSDICGSQSQQ